MFYIQLAQYRLNYHNNSNKYRLLNWNRYNNDLKLSLILKLVMIIAYNSNKTRLLRYNYNDFRLFGLLIS
jgi:hypothetical protein